MKTRNHPNTRSTLLACCLAAAFSVAQAAETDTTSTTTTTPSTTTSGTSTSTSGTTTTAIGTSTNTEAKLSAEFADFLGSEEQASAVVSGLRQGTAFTLDTLVPTPVDSTTTSGTAGPSTTTTITAIDPPTGTMGYGNVRITLRLAEAQLNQMGITQPTTEELAAVLIGGEINGAQVDGILTMRADGMGWGQIAKEYGMTVGQIMGKGALKPTPTPYAQTKASGKASQVSGASTPSGKAAHANGYIPSSPKTMPASSARSNGYIPSGGGKANGAGMVSAAGGSMGGSTHGGGKGQSHKITTSSQSAGLASAGGQHVSMSGSSNGSDKALAPGQAKKN